MSSGRHVLAGHPATRLPLIDVAALLDAYADLKPDPDQPGQRVSFGTSGHRGIALQRSFNAWHVLAITQAVCDYRAAHDIGGPLFLGIDTHALSLPAAHSALEVLAANGVVTRIAPDGQYTPTPAISHAILQWNRGRTEALADGLIITPSHNPPEHGGIKYNGAHGGPASAAATGWIQQRANALLKAGLDGVRRLPYAQARRASSTQEHDFRQAYVADLAQAVDFDLIRDAGVRIGVDPLGGAGVDYWPLIGQMYRLDLSVVDATVDPQFAFMSLDWDGQVRMDPSSTDAMQRLLGLRDAFDIGLACDTDHDRHGIVTRSTGLMPANDYLAVLIDYLFSHRPQWSSRLAVGKTVVSSALIDRVASRLDRRLHEVPAGFKWFVDGLLDGTLGIGVEESAGASCCRRDGAVWTTDKDGIAIALLAAEITARHGYDPGRRYAELADALGKPHAARREAPATAAQKRALSALTPQQMQVAELAGEPVLHILDRAPGNGAPLGGIKVAGARAWFAARPSGTEDLYKIYAESFVDPAHLQAVLQQAQTLVDGVLAGVE
jgi:phosphoglucomutase